MIFDCCRQNRCFLASFAVVARLLGRAHCPGLPQVPRPPRRGPRLPRLRPREGGRGHAQPVVARRGAADLPGPGHRPPAVPRRPPEGDLGLEHHGGGGGGRVRGGGDVAAHRHRLGGHGLAGEHGRRLVQPQHLGPRLVEPHGPDRNTIVNTTTQ